METRNLLKEFYEERLEKSFGIKFETLSEPVKREIEKSIMFQRWKLIRAIRDFNEIIINMRKSKIEWERKMKQLSNTFKLSNKINGSKRTH